MAGSRAYVKQLAATNPSDHPVVIFDCLGYVDTAEGSQRNPLPVDAPGRGDFIALIGNDGTTAWAHDIGRRARHKGACPRGRWCLRGASPKEHLPRPRYAVTMLRFGSPIGAPCW